MATHSVFLENPHGQRSLAGYTAHEVAESEVTEAPEHARNPVTQNRNLNVQEFNI